MKYVADVAYVKEHLKYVVIFFHFLRKGKKDEEKKKGKQKRIWDQGGSSKDLPVLDYSSEKAPVTNGHGHVDNECVTEEEVCIMCCNITFNLLH